MAKQPGYLLDPPLRPRAWVIRLPGVFVAPGGNKLEGSVQTVVVATSENMAWEIAMGCDIWEQLPFDVKNVQIFPKEPLSHGHHSTR